jgi:sarcosine oxidase subunit gamma
VLERRSALAAHPGFKSGARAGAGNGEPGVTIGERRPLAILQVSAFAQTVGDAAGRLASMLELPVPAPNRLSGKLRKRMGAVGPGVWQLVGDPDALPPANSLRRALGGVATVVDLSHARTAFVLGGPAAARTLAKFCSLDLDAGMFPAGSVAATRFGHLGVTLVRTDSSDSHPEFELLVFRGYAEFVFEALFEGAAEFGAQIRGEL